MTDPGELLRRVAPTPRREVTVEELARRSRRRRRGRRQMASGLLVLVVLAGIVTFSTRGGSRSGRVAIEQPPVSTSTSAPTSGDFAPLGPVQMVSPSTVFAAGTNRIIRSDDGGRTWRPQSITCSSCSPFYFADLDMLDSSTGWAASAAGLFHTTDGERWIEQPTGQQYEPSRVQFVSRDEGWILTSPWGAGEYIGQFNAVLSHTTDGGSTWSHVTSVPADVQSVCFANRDDGWLVTRRQVYRSVDAGATWQLALDTPVPPLPDQGVAVIQCASGGAAFVEFAPGGGDTNHPPWVLYSTIDGGQLWTPLMAGGAQLQADTGAPAAEGTLLPRLTLLDRSTALLVQLSPEAPKFTGAFVTNGRDIGPSYVITFSGSSPLFSPGGLSFADPTHGVLVGDNNGQGPSIYLTSDGGRTWTPATEAIGNSPITKAIADPTPVLQRTVTGVDPILLPTAVPADWDIDTVAEANFFQVSYFGPHGETVTLAVIEPNPPPIGPDDHQTSPNFRGNQSSAYFAYDEANPLAARRILIWIEPGTWPVEQRGGVPYELTSEGITEEAFFAIADSLQRIGP